MNQQAFEAGRDAYRQGDLTAAVRWLEQAKQPGEVSGRIDHLLGNCLMKLGNFEQAAIAYSDALADATYGHSGALASNRGRALLAASKPQEAVASLVMATKDGEYPTPYKAYVALGNAYTQMATSARRASPIAMPPSTRTIPIPRAPCAASAAAS